MRARTSSAATPASAPAISTTSERRSTAALIVRTARQTVRVAATDDAAGDLPVTGSLVVPAAALSWRFSRSSGPGGPGVNTADSRVEL